MKTKIMVVDDDANMRDLMNTLLESEGYEVIPAENAAAAQAAFEGPQPDAVLLDLQLPDGHGLDLLPSIKKQWPETEVIVLTGNATFDAAVEATKRGAYHFQNKPVDPKNLMVLVKRALEHKQLNEQASSLRQALSTMTGGASPIFQSSAMKAVVRTVERVAPSDVSLLLTGESGTGKEVIADLVHALSPRAKGPMIKVNCAALPRLRERREDILPLANSFLKRFAAQANRVITGYTPAAAEMLRKFDWPGNVRQLQNEVQRTVLMCEGKMVDVQDLSISAPRVETPEDETNLTLMEAMERNTIVQMLKETGGNKLETAKRLGIGRQTLYNKIKAYGIET